MADVTSLPGLREHLQHMGETSGPPGQDHAGVKQPLTSHWLGLGTWLAPPQERQNTQFYFVSQRGDLNVCQAVLVATTVLPNVPGKDLVAAGQSGWFQPGHRSGTGAGIAGAIVLRFTVAAVQVESAMTRTSLVPRVPSSSDLVPLTTWFAQLSPSTSFGTSFRFCCR